MTKSKVDVVARLESRLLQAGPSRLLDHIRRQLAISMGTLERATRREVDRGRAILAQQRRLLVSFDYHDVLRRGYALVRSEQGHVIARGGALVEGQDVEIRFLDTTANATVTRIAPLREEKDER
jgi:exodeoxyribonuclease VII large subunit